MRVPPQQPQLLPRLPLVHLLPQPLLPHHLPPRLAHLQHQHLPAPLHLHVSYLLTVARSFTNPHLPGPAKATITNGGFEVGPFSAAWTVGFQNQMVTPVRRNANTVGVPAYGNFVVQQIVDDGENAMYQQRVSICPDKRYTITAVAVSESPEPKNPPPYCQLYLCANGPNNCGRPVIIRPGALRRATHTFVTGKTASRIFVQVWLYCPGTLQGRQNTLYTDQVTIDAA